MSVLIASFGFDIDFIVKRIASKKYSKVVLIALKTGSGFKKVEKAYDTLNILCNSLNIACRLEPVTPEALFESVRSILLREVSGPGEVEVYLTGGPRMLVVALLLSLLTLPLEYVSKTKVVVEGEGFECSLLADLQLLIALLKLDERDRIIVSNLEGSRNTLAEIARKTGIPKATLYRRLEELVEKKIVVKEEFYSVKNIAEVTCVE